MTRSHPADGYDGPDRTTPGPSGTAEGVAAFRAAESMRPGEERICYDPYAVYFTSPSRLAQVVADPDGHFPGLCNTIAARVRFFDDTVRAAARMGLEQLVILGAGYDTRAYRIDELKDHVKVFEVDRPVTQEVKKATIRKIFGTLPDHVTFVPLDLGIQDLGSSLREYGYSPRKKTLFVMEGLLMYLPPKTVDELLSCIRSNSGRGSAILFDGSRSRSPGSRLELKVRSDLRDHIGRHGEPIRFMIPEEGLEVFLQERGFSGVRTVSSDDYSRMYFHGINSDRVLYRSISFYYAVAN